jgi:hypothetical protein
LILQSWSELAQGISTHHIAPRIDDVLSVMERDEMQREKHENTKISFGNIFVVVLVFQALGHCRSRITRAEYFQYRGARTACAVALNSWVWSK